MASKGEYHDNFDDASAAAAFARAAQPRLFDRAEYLAPLHAAAFADQPLRLLRVARDGAELWLPMVEEARGRLKALSNWYSFRWSPVFRHAEDDALKSGLMRAAARSLQSRAHAVTLSPIAEEDAALLQRAFAAEGWHARMEQCDENHILRVRGRSFDEYWADRPGRLRSTVKRKGKSSAVQTRILTHFDKAAWADYQTVYARSWKPEEGSPDLLEGLAQSESAGGSLRLGLAYVEGRCVAAQFWTCEHGEALIHKLAYDERYAKASAGTLLTHALFRHVIDEDRVDLVDYGTGSDAYKRDWMEDMRPRFRLTAIRPRHPANWPGMAKALLARLVRRGMSG
ncbi:GNAT family N-acetyltransferase [Novosphingopyxis sp.]|uniref:GNAT family N-acetyltransferase n=1 Tax=Novosphingopyxis sp. TaxID=2709690 RepID=UPI003B5A5722